MDGFKAHCAITINARVRYVCEGYYYVADELAETLVVADDKGYIELVHDWCGRYHVVVYTHPDLDPHPWLGWGPKGRALMVVSRLQDDIRAH